MGLKGLISGRSKLCKLGKDRILRHRHMKSNFLIKYNWGKFKICSFYFKPHFLLSKTTWFAQLS